MKVGRFLIAAFFLLSAALASGERIVKDASGKIEGGLFAMASVRAAHPTVTIMPAGYVVVGGGVEIKTGSNYFKKRIRKNSPSESNGWMAGAKDHINQDTVDHIEVCAIGIHASK